jgi:hypothetical protein
MMDEIGGGECLPQRGAEGRRGVVRIYRRGARRGGEGI